MSDSRTDHACAAVNRNGRNYLVVMGGSKGAGLTSTDTIEFYDMTRKPTTWENVNGIRLPVATDKLFGWKISLFDEGICEALLFNYQGNSYTCSGNYTWIYYKVPGYVYSKTHLPIVDANLLGGDTIW
jgi:hypothetical protein